MTILKAGERYKTDDAISEIIKVTPQKYLVLTYYKKSQKYSRGYYWHHQLDRVFCPHCKTSMVTVRELDESHTPYYVTWCEECGYEYTPQDTSESEATTSDKSDPSGNITSGYEASAEHTPKSLRDFSYPQDVMSNKPIRGDYNG